MREKHLTAAFTQSPEKSLALLIGTYGAKDRAICEEQLEELKDLGETFGVGVSGSFAAPLREIQASTFLGKGKVAEISSWIRDNRCDLVIFDDELSPQQQRNLEKALGKPVIDRTELILGVFAQRAQTKEARLQVELATCRYQLPRLRHLWTHLSRQKSGGASGGAVKGEGEKQIEIDRRILRTKIHRLEVELEEVKKHRQTQKKARFASSLPTFAIIGYTNVGKSTLMQALTDADILVEDKLFATLDTTTRKFVLPNQQSVLLIDTVGFIRKIPHLLVAAFKSTLEEALSADILLHLIDVSHPSAERQAEATYAVLEELQALNRPIITVLNKVDLCESRLCVDRFRFKYPKVVEISAAKKEGLDALMDRMLREVASLRTTVYLRLPQSQYALVSELLREGEMLQREYEGNDILLKIEIPKILEKKVSHFVVQPFPESSPS